MSATVEIEGLAALLAALKAFPDTVAPELERASRAALLRLIPTLATYPPAAGGSRYHRTGTLGRLWTSATPVFSASGSGFEAAVANATPYGPFVQDADSQAFWNSDWTTTEAALEANADAMASDFEAALARVLKQFEG